MNRKILCAVLTLFSGSAFATGNIEIRLAGGSYEFDDSFTDTDLETDEAGGGEIRGRFDFTPNVFGRASYLASETDEVEIDSEDFDVDLEFDVFRAGVGYEGGSSVRFYGVAEYLSAGLSIDGDNSKNDGVVIAGGIKDKGEGAFLWNVELGIVQLDDLEGGTFEFTLGWRINPAFALLFGGQSYVVENDDVEFSFTHVTLGGRVSF